MDTKKLDRWADLLLDPGKRNSLINFKDVKASTAEIIIPNSSTLFEITKESSHLRVHYLDYHNHLTLVLDHKPAGESFLW